MLRFYIVLIFLLVVPIALGLALGGIVILSKGNVPMAGFMWAAAGFLVWYLCGPLRRFWKSKETELDNLNDIADMVGGSGE
ncbi:hypothetical protein ACFY4C_18035 [Actinomadura viridis]|uniref:hypothetical protein n=1 Tax=Actinomadura viridis TaxID=58110 RepID=UPI00368D36E1